MRQRHAGHRRPSFEGRLETRFCDLFWGDTEHTRIVSGTFGDVGEVVPTADVFDAVQVWQASNPASPIFGGRVAAASVAAGSRYHNGSSTVPDRCPGVELSANFLREVRRLPSQTVATPRGGSRAGFPASLGRFTAAVARQLLHFGGAAGRLPRRIVLSGSVRRVAERLGRWSASLFRERRGTGCSIRHPPFGACGGTQAGQFRQLGSATCRQGWTR